MKWTTDKPTEPGWYWMDDGDNWYKQAVRIDVAPRSLGTEQLCVYSGIAEFVGLVDNCKEGAKWAGPIPEPEDE